jgi:poly(hydroxyalkanoate) depolymerase family esterase
MNTRLQDLMRDAARLTQASRLHDATSLLQRALGGALASGRPAAAQEATGNVQDAPAQRKAGAFAGFLDALGRLGTKQPPLRDRPAAGLDAGVGDVWDLDADVFVPAGTRDEDGAAPSPGEGEFLSGSHTHASLTRQYKLFVPPQAAQRALPLVVMLHGCKQNPDDFAAGTDMNRLAAEQGFCVLYPAQAQDANPSRCWNWFKHSHQERGRGEPAVIASMTQAVVRERGLDPLRVYIAGLSAGGAMAAIVGGAYPEVFAAVGVHSGLAPGAARSLPEALMAMNGGVAAAANPAAPSAAGMANLPFGAPGAGPGKSLPQPVIVFHGDMDRTVHPRNGDEVVKAALGGLQHADAAAGAPAVEQGVSAHGRRYTRHLHRRESGEVSAEHWLVHGAGHAWSGGRQAGSYTDAAGPDASREMLRFFFEHPRGETQ